VVAALAPEPKVATPPVPAPRLAAEPRLIDRPSRLTQPTSDERAKLAQLVALASFEPQLVSAPKPAARPKPLEPAMASLTGIAPKPPVAAPIPAPKVAALAPDSPPSLIDGAGLGWNNGWAQAPAFDEEHPDELSYRPFPVSPYMTASASPDDPALVHMIHPDVGRTLELLDQAGSMPPMRLRPTPQVARLLWAQEFKGGLADVDKLFAKSRPAFSEAAARLLHHGQASRIA
jgi:hypothetical protein